MAKQKRLLTPSDADKEAAEEQIKQKQQEVKYDLRDFTVDYLVKSFRDDLFFIPDYQREFIWPEKNRSKFIESLLLGLPIPMLFVADMADGRLEIVDGAQRVQTLEQFMSGDLVLEELTLLTRFNGFSFNDLSISQQRKLQTRALRLVVLEDNTSEEIRQELFNRINTQSVKAKGIEVRRGSYKGGFVNFIKESAQTPLFRVLCPLSESLLSRREDEELITRFFCYSERYQKFRHDVEKFLDEYVKEHRDHFDKAKLKSEFEAMLAFVNAFFPSGFAKSKTLRATPRVRFEAIAVGVTLALREVPGLVPARPVSEWLESSEFASWTTTHASNSGPRLRGRIEFVRDQLLSGQGK